MRINQSLLRALPVASLAVVMAASTAVADFQPSVQWVDGINLEHLIAADLAAQGEAIAVSVDRRYASDRHITFRWSDDSGATSRVNTTYGIDVGGAQSSQVTVCDGHMVLIYRAASRDTTPVWSIETVAYPIDGIPGVAKRWGAEGALKPDIACVANDEVVTAWFERDGGGYDVRVRTRHAVGISTSPQSFDLGSGTPKHGLAIATSSARVYIAWFQGHALKLRRFAIGGPPSHTLTSLGTSTIATLQYGRDLEIGADGDRVTLAYQDRADLKVRRSNNRGISFGSAQTLRDEPFPSEIGASPTTVAVKGSKVVIGAVELAGVETLTGKGLGYLSTDGGSSYTKVSMHASGRIVAGLLRVGSTYRYAEAWDQSISDPDDEEVRFRRQ